MTNYKTKKKLSIDESTDTREELDGKDTQYDTKQDLGSIELSLSTSLQEINVMINEDSQSGKLTRPLSEPPNLYSTRNVTHCDNLSNDCVRRNSESTLASVATNVQNSPSKTCASNVKSSETLNVELHAESACTHNLQSPMVKNRFRNVYAVHTSTPSSLLRSLATNDYILTPITNNDRSMSPITQSATKMTKAMQVRKFQTFLYKKYTCN